MALQAQQEQLKFSADEYETDLGTRETTAHGNVVVDIGTRHIVADEVILIPKENSIKAKGSVIVSEGDLSIEGKSAVVEMNSTRGFFKDAVLKKGNSLYVEGRELRSLGEDRYQISNGKISFCRDCPQSWSVFGTSIEMEIEGYVEVHHALFQIKDQPVAYFPVFYFPIKQKRQSGFLLPEVLHSSDLGSQLIQPYFWAMGSDQDMTLSYHYMTEGGHRLINDYRYFYSDRSYVTALSSFNRNLAIQEVEENRYGFSVEERYQINPAWTQRFKGEFASDPRYAGSFAREFENGGLPTLMSRLSLAYQNDWSVSFIQGLWNVDNLVRELDSGPVNGGALHALPEFRFAVPSLVLLGPIRFQSELYHLSLRRSGPSVDPITGWIREGDRTSLRNSLFLPFYFFDVALLESKVSTRIDAYSFQNTPYGGSAARARVAIEEKLSTQIFRVYEMDVGTLKAIKHTWEPVVTWGYSPNDATTQHEFFRQVSDLPDGRDNVSSPKFDIFDPSPDSALASLGTSSEEIRLRSHHLVSLGVETRLVGRFDSRGKSDYEELLTFSVTQDYDIKNQEPQRLNIRAVGSYGGVRGSSEIAIDVNTGDANLRNELRVSQASFDARVIQSIRPELERYGGSVTVKFLKPLGIQYSGSYDAISESFTNQHLQLRYDSDSSKCWFVSLDIDRQRDVYKPGKVNTRYWPKVGLVINEAGVTL